MIKYTDDWVEANKIYNDHNSTQAQKDAAMNDMLAVSSAASEVRKKDDKGEYDSLGARPLVDVNKEKQYASGYYDANEWQQMKTVYTDPGRYEITTTGQVAYKDNTGNWVEAQGNGQIVIPELYVYANYSKATNSITQTDSKTISGIKDFTMNSLEYNVPNCALVATTLILDYYYNKYTLPGRSKLYDLLGLDKSNLNISEGDIYKIVRAIGVEYGFDSQNSGAWNESLENIWYNLFEYTNGDVIKIVRDSLDEVGIHATASQVNFLSRSSRFLDDGKIMSQMKNEINHDRPFIINNAFGDYSAHTVTGVGYQSYYDKTKNKNINLVQVYDGWSDSFRYIDWNRQGPSSIIMIVPNIHR